MQELVPEEIELAKKERVVERLADRLADAEEELTDLRAELERFEARYTMEVGRLYAERFIWELCRRPRRCDTFVVGGLHRRSASTL